VPLGEGRIGRGVYRIIYKRGKDNGRHISPDFVQLLPFKHVQVETWTQCENIFGQKEASYREADCGARNLTGEGNPR